MGILENLSVLKNLLLLHSVYFLNRSPTVTVQDKILEETCSGTKPSVTHHRIFGSVAFSHIPDELRKNLDKKSEHCIFTGYSEQHKAYKLYNHVIKKVAVSRDVKIIKEKCWSDPSNIQHEDHIIKLPILEVQ